jgi:predicted ATP-binding protein involved in virulence
MAGVSGAPAGYTRTIGTGDARVQSYEHEGLIERQPQWPVRVTAEGTLDAKHTTWELTRTGEELMLPGGLLPVVQDLATRVARGEASALPAVAYYGTGRLWPRDGTTQVKRGVGSRFDGYSDALDADASHRQLAEWMFQQTLVELQRRRPVPQLRAVERAVCQCVEGASRFFFDVQGQELILDRAGAQPLPFSALSDGYRNMVALVADIAWRASVLNPHFGDDAAARSEGVILIDEIDLHLHPRWQRRVLSDLRRTFPNLQFVTTTHSPQIISSVRRDELRVLSDNALLPARPFVEGRDTNSLLEDVLGVPERPEAVRAQIDEMARVLDEGRYEEAKTLVDALEAHLGPDDPAVIRARWILDREAVPNEGG